MAISISTVAPTTRLNTPRSKSVALARGTLPITGRSTYWKYEVRKGAPNRTDAAPVNAASKRPPPIQSIGRMRSLSSTHTVPAAMYCKMKPAAIATPATKPPPGAYGRA